MAKVPLERTDMVLHAGQIRMFSPREILNFLGFPVAFEFPAGVGMKAQWKMCGNSLSVTMVSYLMRILLTTDWGG